MKETVATESGLSRIHPATNGRGAAPQAIRDDATTREIPARPWPVFDWPRRLFQLVFRMVPYPTKPRLIKIGSPNRKSPVLVTTNYDLTVRRVCRALAGTDCYLLVAPAAGLDVWCAAGGGRFSIDSIISIIKTSRIAEIVDHRRLLLPELSASGINMFDLKRRAGWIGIFGPVEIEDVPEFLKTKHKTETMTRVTFTVLQRLEMAVAMWGSLTLRFTLFPALIFGWRAGLWFGLTVALFSLAISLGCFVVPGKTFVQKSGVLALIGYAVTLGILSYLDQATPFEAVKWATLIGFASFLAGTAFPSYSPYWPCGYSKLFYGSCDLQLEVIETQCIGCGVCDNVCPVECFALTDQKKMEFVNPKVCVGCGACVLQCPTDAIINEVAEEHLRQATCS